MRLVEKCFMLLLFSSCVVMVLVRLFVFIWWLVLENWFGENSC